MLEVVVPPLVGGLLIGLAAALLLFATGRIAGVSGILAGLAASPGDRGWRVAFLAGLLAGGLLLRGWMPEAFGPAIAPWTVMAAAGLLVGVGTRVGGGCTSGHGVCGLGRFSPRSLIAVMTFMLTAAVTVALS